MAESPFGSGWMIRAFFNLRPLQIVIHFIGEMVNDFLQRTVN